MFYRNAVLNKLTITTIFLLIWINAATPIYALSQIQSLHPYEINIEQEDESSFKANDSYPARLALIIHLTYPLTTSIDTQLDRLARSPPALISV